MKKSEVIKTLDRLTTKILFVKERGRCWHCGVQATDTAHIFRRDFLTTRWETEADGNVHLLCRVCHLQAHQHPEAYERWYVARYSDKAFTALRRRAQSVSVLFIGELHDKLMTMEWELSELRNNEATETV